MPSVKQVDRRNVHQELLNKKTQPAVQGVH